MRKRTKHAALVGRKFQDTSGFARLLNLSLNLQALIGEEPLHLLCLRMGQGGLPPLGHSSHSLHPSIKAQESLLLCLQSLSSWAWSPAGGCRPPAPLLPSTPWGFGRYRISKFKAPTSREGPASPRTPGPSSRVLFISPPALSIGHQTIVADAALTPGSAFCRFEAVPCSSFFGLVRPLRFALSFLEGVRKCRDLGLRNPRTAPGFPTPPFLAVVSLWEICGSLSFG